MTKDPYRATGAHVSLIAHITLDELKGTIAKVDIRNGFANRFLWFLVRRSKVLPHGGRVPPEAIDAIAARLHKVVHVVLEGPRRVLWRDKEADRLWEDAYSDLSEAGAGTFGAVTSRAEAQVLRLSLIFAVLDGSAVIRREHLEAALAFWDYARESARAIFASERDVEHGEQDRLCEWIRLHGGSATPRDLARGPRRYRDAPKPAEAAEADLEKLVEEGLGRWSPMTSKAVGGRPSRRFLLLDGDGDETPVLGGGDSGDGDETNENPENHEVLSPSPLSPAGFCRQHDGGPAPPSAELGETGSRASVKLMLTKADEAALRALGYSQPEINAMLPKDAGQILATGRKPREPGEEESEEVEWSA